MRPTQRRHTAARLSPSNHEESGLSHRHPAGEAPPTDAIVRARFVPGAQEERDHRARVRGDDEWEGEAGRRREEKQAAGGGKNVTSGKWAATR